MLTVDYQRLGLQPGELVLDLGCGAGRHAFESLRRGARVVAFDYDAEELAGVRDQAGSTATAGPMATAGSTAAAGDLDGTGRLAATRGDAVHLPFADDTFDRIIAAEVLEHIPDDDGAVAELERVLKPGGTMAVTVPAWLPEKICWKLSDQYHAPAVDGGHLRIYRADDIRAKLRRSGLHVDGHHHAHALHSPYWWLRCAIHPQESDGHPAVRAYHRLLTWDITRAPALTRVAERLLNPVLGKSLVVYSSKSSQREPAPRMVRAA